MENRAVDKIKKLLRMKSGGTSAEIATALDLAKKLADKHNIDISKININELREPITHSRTESLSRLQVENKYSAIIVNRFFNVNAFMSNDYVGKHIVFVGRESDIEIAKYTYTFLVRHFRREWNTKRGRLKKRQSFMKGLYTGIYHKLRSLESSYCQTEGIILSTNSAERDKYLQSKFGDLDNVKIKTDHDSQRAMRKGFDCGVKTNLHKGISSQKNNNILK